MILRLVGSSLAQYAFTILCRQMDSQVKLSCYQNVEQDDNKPLAMCLAQQPTPLMMLHQFVENLKVYGHLHL